MNHEMMSKRLASKSVKQSIISKLGKDFNLTPILAEAYFTQVQEYFLAHGQIDLTTGQMHYLAIDENEPAGKPIALCKKLSVKLSVHRPEEDLAVYKKSGLAGLRQHKIIRITNEAIEQCGVLSYEDIAFILTTSVVTVKRDMSAMRRRGIILPSRGWRQQMGRGQTHKAQILELYLSGYQFTQIEQKTYHSEGAIKRYIQDFARVVLLHKKAFSLDQIRITTGFSHRLIGEYLALAKRHATSPHLKRILQMTKKKGR